MVQLTRKLEALRILHVLKEEEDHIDWLEAQKDQIKQMGIKNYLVEQID